MLLSDLSNSSSGQLRLELVPNEFWQPPECLRGVIDMVNHSVMGYKMGYLHMMRFYGMHLFKILHKMGYSWAMREDDDSEILSPIEYDLVQHMKGKNGPLACDASTGIWILINK